MHIYKYPRLPIDELSGDAEIVKDRAKGRSPSYIGQPHPWAEKDKAFARAIQFGNIFATHAKNNKTKNLKEMSYKIMLFFISVVEPYNPDNRTRAFKYAPISRRSFTGGNK
jgi:hypothetical protein